MAQKPPPARGKKGDPLIGAVIDRRWKILEQIGTGGMGAVYRAERVQLGKQVALKFLHAGIDESESAVARFEREAKTISRLHHVHCISILDYGVYRRRPYIVMEFIEGRQLNELDPDAVTPPRAVQIMRQVLLGLAHAHSRGVIHRDLKLSNVMMVEMTGTEPLIKLLDFGLARVTDNPETSLTREGMVAGTPTYMSPEQAQGKKVDHRTDIYSAGVMLYTLATGRRPFEAQETAALLRKQVHEAPTPPRKMAPQKRISETLERVILRALEKNPDDRFQSASDFLRAVDETPEGQATQTPTVLRQRPPRRRLILLLAVACVALGAAGALFARAHYQQVRDEITSRLPWNVDAAAPPPVVKTTPPPPVKHVVAPPPPPVDAAVKVVTAPPPPDAAATPPVVERTVDQIPPAPQETPAVEITPEMRERRHHIEQVLASGNSRGAIKLLRDDPKDPWAHLRLGDLYAQTPLHWRHDAFREWTTALSMDAALKSDRGMRGSLCEAVDTSDATDAVEFFKKNFDPDETAKMLNACIGKAQEAGRVENTARVLEAVAGAERPELGAAALRQLDLAKSCAQKKAAVETLARLRYKKARSALGRLERTRAGNPQLSCLGNAVADALKAFDTSE